MEKSNQEIKSILEDREIEYQEYKHGELKGFVGIIALINEEVNLEWKTNKKMICFGWKNSLEDVKRLKEATKAKFGDVFCATAKDYVGIYKNAKPSDFENVLDWLRDSPVYIEQKVIPPRGKVKADISKYYLKTAQLVRFGVDNSYPYILNRGLGFDKIDRFITVGKSKNAANAMQEESLIREHVVPCDFLICEMVEMIREKKSDTEVALMLRQNLFIVTITSEEQKKLDNKLEMGMKISMPEGWKIGDNPLQRLIDAGIELE